jgi:type IV secretory pathway TraG/TraD family ATPase VirD4
MNTASNKIILRVNDPDTAEIFARQIGTERDTDYRTESYNSQGQMAGYSKPQVEKFRVHPNQIKELLVGQAIVRIMDNGGVRVGKVNLNPAETAPAEFKPYFFSDLNTHRNKKNESSIPELIKEGEGGTQGKGPKHHNDFMGDEDVA